MNKKYTKSRLSCKRWKLTLFSSVLLVSTQQVLATDLNMESSVNIVAQQNRIEGQVLDNEGVPLAGVTVQEKGTTNSTVTNEDGEYTITVQSGTSILVFSYVGYESSETSASQANRVVLIASENSLDEVIVVGFGTQRKKDLTGAVSQVGEDVINNRPVANLGQALQGAVPNLNVGFGDGSPNTSATFNVRGTTSLNVNDNQTSNGSPLILVDGVPGDINRINPEDVESVTVLKDAASAAIYGARAAFGVMLITTKSGKAGRSQVSYQNSFQYSTPTAIPNILNAEHIQEAIVLGYENRGLTAPSDELIKLDKIREYMNDPVNNEPYFMGGTNEDNVVWIDNLNPYNEALRASSPLQKHNLSISGGNERTTYYGSVGYQNQDGIYKVNNDNMKRYNATLNLSSQVNDWFKMDFRTSYNNSTYSEPRSPAGKGGWWAAMSQEPFRNVFMPMKTPASSPVGEMYTDNILSFMDYGATDSHNTGALMMTASPKITPLPGWNIQADISYKNYNNNRKEVVPLLRRIENNWNTTTAHTDPSYIYRYDMKSNHYTMNFFTDYTKTFGDDHNFSGLLGMNQEWYTEGWMSARRNDINPNVPTLGQAQGIQLVGDGEQHWAVRGLFYRLTYDYKGKYLIQSNGRYDGTSRFRTDRRFNFFPSVSAGWVVSEEDFASDITPYVNFLKLRASYGSLGNQNVSNYAYILSYQTNSNLQYLFNGLRPNHIVPPGLLDANLTWETSATIDIGADITLFNKFDFTFDWYRRTTWDILAPADQLPAVLGASVPLSNSGEIQTTGWDLIAKYRNTTSYGLRYDFTATLGDYTSKITRFNGNNEKLLGSLYEGMNIGEIWGYETYGLFQSQEEIDQAPDHSKVNSGIWFPGDVRYVDLDGNGEISTGSNTLDDPGDRRIIGNNTPRYQFGFITNLNYKNIDFNLFLQGTGKRDVWVGNNLFWGAGTTGTYEVYNNSWTPENQDAYYPLYYSAGKNRNVQTRYLQNGAYLRIKNISLGYTVPSTVSETIKFKSLRVFGSAFNLFEFKSVPKTFDPELLGMNYPIMRSYAFGVQATF